MQPAAHGPCQSSGKSHFDRRFGVAPSMAKKVSANKAIRQCAGCAHLSTYTVNCQLSTFNFHKCHQLFINYTFFSAHGARNTGLESGYASFRHFQAKISGFSNFSRTSEVQKLFRVGAELVSVAVCIWKFGGFKLQIQYRESAPKPPKPFPPPFKELSGTKPPSLP